jgi:hypothetical protein
MATWKKYTSLERVKRIRYSGRELLGKPLYITVKRDGECVNPWIGDDDSEHVGSRNHPNAASDIANRMKNTPEWERVLDMIRTEKADYRSEYIPYGELLKTISPTRIEPRRKHIHWIMFDIWDVKNECYLPYNRVHQLGKKYRIPVVKLLEIAECNTMDELSEMIEDHMKWCKRHRREGIVIKCYNAYNQHDIQKWVFCKEKIDVPRKVKVRGERKTPQYPIMGEEKALRTLKAAYDWVCKAHGEEKWKDTKIAMPIVAHHFQVECREHLLSMPKDLYPRWLNTPLEVLRSKDNE